MPAVNVDLQDSDVCSAPDTFRFHPLSQTRSMPGAHTQSLFPTSDDCSTDHLTRRRKREGPRSSVGIQCMVADAEANFDQCESSPEQVNPKKKMLKDWQKQEAHLSNVQDNLRGRWDIEAKQYGWITNPINFRQGLAESSVAPAKEMGVPFDSDLEDHTCTSEEPQCFGFGFGPLHGHLHADLKRHPIQRPLALQLAREFCAFGRLVRGSPIAVRAEMLPKFKHATLDHRAI